MNASPGHRGPIDPSVAAFERARSETVRYHGELYARVELGEPGTWLARPHPLITSSLGLVRGRGPMVAYDLGAGVGRHTILIARSLDEGSHVVAVDLLDGAIERLRRSADRAGVGPKVVPVVCDLEVFEPSDPAGLVVVFSALEHLRSPQAVARVLARMQAVTTPGGLHVLGVFCDRTEVSAGRERPALVELPWTAGRALAALDAVYDGWRIRRRELLHTAAIEARDGNEHVLRSTLVQYVAELAEVPRR